MTLRDLMNWERAFDVPVLKRRSIEPSFGKLQEEMNRFFEHFYRGMEVHMTDWNGKEVTSIPAVDLLEKEDSFSVEVELPGISPESVDISITRESLTIKGERKEEKEEKNENYICRETSCGSFFRQIPLPKTALCDDAEASFKNGILTIKIPKTAEASQKPRKLEIKKVA